MLGASDSDEVLSVHPLSQLLGGATVKSLLSDGGRLQLHLVAAIRGAQISITGLVLSASSPNIIMSLVAPKTSKRGT